MRSYFCFANICILGDFHGAETIFLAFLLGLGLTGFIAWLMLMPMTTGLMLYIYEIYSGDDSCCAISEYISSDMVSEMFLFLRYMVLLLPAARQRAPRREAYGAKSAFATLTLRRAKLRFLKRTRAAAALSPARARALSSVFSAVRNACRMTFSSTRLHMLHDARYCRGCVMMMS